MTALDPGTLWIVVGALGFAVTGAFTALSRQARGVQGLGSLALAHGLLSTSGVLVAGAGLIPPLLSFTASHALAVLGAALLGDGVRLLHGLPARRRLNVVLFVMVAGALSAAGDLGEGRASARLPIAIALPNAILGALLADAGLTTVRRGRRPGEAFTGGVVALCFGVVSAGRLAVSVVALGGGPAVGYWMGRGGDPFLTGSLLASLLAGMGWTFGLFATVNRRFIALSARQAEYRATLGELALTVMDRLELTPLLETVVSRGVALLKADMGFLYLETPDAKALRCRVWLGERPVDELVAPDEGAVGLAWRSGQPVSIADYDAWPDRSPKVPLGVFGSMLAVPLRSAGRAVGSLGIARGRPGRRFGEEQTALLAGFGDLASIALDNARLFERERDARERSERLQAATQSLSSSLDVSSVLDSILRELTKVLAADSVSIERSAGTSLEVLAARGVASSFLGRSLDPGTGDGRRARVLEGRTPLILDDATFQSDAPWTATPTSHSWLGAPLLIGGQAVGLLILVKGEAGYYTPEHARLAAAFADQAAVALENARLYQDARREIEERKRAQAELERSEARHRDLFEQSLALICSHDLTGTLLSVNPAAATNLGCTPSALVGRNLGELIPEPHRAGLPAYLEEIQRVGEAAGVMTIQSSSGRRAWRYRNVLRRASAEAPYVIGFAEDVTEEMRSQAALKDSEERFRQVADNLDAVLFVRQVAPPAILYVSPAYRTIFGRDPGALPPDAESLFGDVWPEDRERVTAAFSADQTTEGTFDETYRVVRPDRAIRWVHTRTFPGLRNPAGRIERIVGITEDITPLKQAEALRADLVRTLVHDLRTPLTSILGCLELLTGRDPGKDPNLMLIAARNAKKLQQMVDSLLDIDRLEQNDLALQRDSVGLPELIEEARGLVAGAAQQKTISVTQVAEAALPEAWADPDLLLRVLTNLLGNAVKFTPDQGRVVVSAEMASEEAMLRVHVRDSGPGIPKDLAPRLFQKFVTGRSKGAGSGLGLAFCRLVVEAHGGHIAIEEVEPPGASVAFTLPVAKPN